MKTICTLASCIALSGRNIRGKAYIAPMTSLHRTPSIWLSVSLVILAFRANSPKTWFFSCKQNYIQ